MKLKDEKAILALRMLGYECRPSFTSPVTIEGWHVFRAGEVYALWSNSPSEALKRVLHANGQ